MSVELDDVASAEVRPVRRSGGNPVVRAVVAALTPLASLKLTVVLFSLSTLLVFVGTLAQVNQGIGTVVNDYFYSYFVFVPAQLLVQFADVFFLPDAAGGSVTVSPHAGFWLPGGKLLGYVMLANLTAAHLVRFRAVSTAKEIGRGFAAGVGPGLGTLAVVFARRAGVWATHLGLILLFVGEIGTREGQVEQRMTIAQGQTVGFAVETHRTELAFTDRSKPGIDTVTVVPDALLREAATSGRRVTRPGLPYSVAVDEFHANSDLVAAEGGYAGPTVVIGGPPLKLKPLAEGAGVGSQRIDTPAAVVTLYPPGSDTPAGAFLVSAVLGLSNAPPRVVGPVDMELRFVRHYKPFTLTLAEFRFDRYPGTNQPKNYSSRLQLRDPEKGEDREVLIRMNEPLRHRGETFYQSSFDPSEKGTVLQVVRNPVDWVPYAACILMAGGLVLHFSYYLVQFLARTLMGTTARPKAPASAAVAGVSPGVAGYRPPPPTWRQTVWVWGAVGVAVLAYFGGYVSRTTPKADFDLSAVAAVPVLEGGRVKPLDTFARVQLRILNHSEQYLDKSDTPRGAVEWFMDFAAAADASKSRVFDADIFRVENDQVRNVLELKRKASYRYSWKEIAGTGEGASTRFRAFAGEVEKAQLAAKKDKDEGTKTLDVYQKKLLELGRHLSMAGAIRSGAEPRLLPPAAGGTDWRTPASVVEPAAGVKRQFLLDWLATQNVKPDEAIGDVFRRLPPDQVSEVLAAADERQEQARAALVAADPAATAWQAVLAAYRANDQDKFDAAVAAFRALHPADPATAAAARVELRLNRLAPFYHLIPACVLVGLLTAAGWVGLFANPAVAEACRRAAFWVLLAAFAGLTLSLVGRMYLSGRWLVFVTNLYSSAVFIAWGGMLMGLVAERVFPLGLGTFLAATLGGVTGIIAHNLADSGDTLEMQEAVLDTNLWLATHVTTVTFGYSATYAAGLLGLAYLALDLTSNVLTKPMHLGGRVLPVGRAIGMLTYGVVCFATLLSLVGTVLGGIWADQSWGRFWGWDPKENGAIMIVVWNALILHARWGGMVKDRGVAMLAVAGNMVVTWSWFGTNQLGVGLHAYGFNKTLADGCAAVWLVHGAVVAAAGGMGAYDRLTKGRAG